MPTNPQSPGSNAAIDRLTLGVASPRGAEPASPYGPTCICFDAEASAVIFGCYGSSCFEAE